MKQEFFNVLYYIYLLYPINIVIDEFMENWQWL